MGRMRCWRFSSTFVNLISYYKGVICNIFDNLFLFFPLLFEFLSFIIRFFIHDSFEKLSILNFNVLKLFVSESMVEAFIHFLFIVVSWVYFCRSLDFESRFFSHDGINFLEKHTILSFYFCKAAFLKHVLFFV